MNNNEINPFKVPEGFFEEARSKALEGASEVRKRRRRTGVAIASGMAALALVAAIGLTARSRTAAAAYDESSYWLAESEYDVFLENELYYENEVNY